MDQSRRSCYRRPTWTQTIPPPLPSSTTVKGFSATTPSPTRRPQRSPRRGRRGECRRTESRTSATDTTRRNRLSRLTHPLTRPPRTRDLPEQRPTESVAIPPVRTARQPRLAPAPPVSLPRSPPWCASSATEHSRASDLCSVPLRPSTSSVYPARERASCNSRASPRMSTAPVACVVWSQRAPLHVGSWNRISPQSLPLVALEKKSGIDKVAHTITLSLNLSTHSDTTAVVFQ